MILQELKVGDKFQLVECSAIAKKHVFEYRGEYKLSTLCDQVRAEVKTPWGVLCYWDLETKVIVKQLSIF